VVPTYNHPVALKQTLTSIAAAIEAAGAGDYVRTLVVDDYSSDAVEEVVQRRCIAGDTVDFRLHAKPRGVAEVALLDSLVYVDSEFVWFVGCGDVVLADALVRLLPLLKTTPCDFHLLNYYRSIDDAQSSSHLSGPVKTLTFANGALFFENFGFISLTTTFAGLCFRVRSLKRVDIASLATDSGCYLHTTALFAAFYRQPCAFHVQPYAISDGNKTLTAYGTHPGRPAPSAAAELHYATVGLARKLDHLHRVTHVPIRQLVLAREDELRLDTLGIKRSLTGTFILTSLLRQLQRELETVRVVRADFRYLTIDDMHFLQRFFDASGVVELSTLCAQAHRVYCDLAADFDNRALGLQAILDEALEFESAYLKNLDSHCTPIAHLVYSRHSGVKLIHCLDQIRPQPTQVAFDETLQAAAHPSRARNTMTFCCAHHDLAESLLPLLLGIGETTAADLVVFNNHATSEQFTELFGPTRQQESATPRRLSMWERSDIRRKDLGKLLRSALGDFRLGALVPPQRCAAGRATTRAAQNATVEFIDWKTLA